eukprot:COSAG04_NODE_21839_length_366_cov_1.104869_2_plen_26_part_01
MRGALAASMLLGVASVTAAGDVQPAV